MTRPDVFGAKRTALGDDGGDEGAMLDPTLEGLTSTMTGVTNCLPRDVGIVVVDDWYSLLTNVIGDSVSVVDASSTMILTIQCVIDCSRVGQQSNVRRRIVE